MKIGSLFSGVGGLEMGLERAGVGTTVWQVEADPYCRAVLAKHWPDAKRFDDVCTVGADHLEPVDVICGGFPCQDISFAGKGAGLSGARSGLWYEFARIIRELRPRYVVVENVAALLVRGMGDVLGTLASLGYDAEWSSVQACDVGAPHGRDRVFIVAYAGPARAARLEPWAYPRIAGPWGWRGEADLCALADAPHVGNDRWPQPIVRRMDDGLRGRVDRLGALGNSVVPQVAEVVGRRLLAIAGAAP